MIKNSNTVYERQNQPEMQALIVAQHFAYTSAKRWVLSLFFILVIITNLKQNNNYKTITNY